MFDEEKIVESVRRTAGGSLNGHSEWLIRAFMRAANEEERARRLDQHTKTLGIAPNDIIDDL